MRPARCVAIVGRTEERTSAAGLVLVFSFIHFETSSAITRMLVNPDTAPIVHAKVLKQIGTPSSSTPSLIGTQRTFTASRMDLMVRRRLLDSSLLTETNATTPTSPGGISLGSYASAKATASLHRLELFPARLPARMTSCRLSVARNSENVWFHHGESGGKVFETSARSSAPRLCCSFIWESLQEV